MRSATKINSKSYVRSAFPSMQALADFLDRTRNYCSARLNNEDLDFTESEMLKILEAVRFHRATGKYLTEVEQDIKQIPERFAYETTVYMIRNGMGVLHAVECGVYADSKLGSRKPGIETDLLTYFNAIDRRSGS